MPRTPEPEKFPAFIAKLRERMEDRYGLIDSRYFRWIAGDVPDAIHFLVEHRELLTALYEDGVRHEMAHPNPADTSPVED
jgi:hypothetical protein